MKALPLLLVTLVGLGCATNPATGRRQLILMSEQQEVQAGRESDAEIRKQMGVYNDAELQRYVSSVGMKLVQQSHRPDLPWTFTVVDEPAVNAFALPGGFIYITRGILPFLQNEAELAGVIGHEIGHVDARHSAEAYSKQLGAGLGLAAAGIFAPSTQPLQGVAGAGLQVLLLKYGREAELEADRLGVGYESGVGWDPRGVPNMLNTLARLDEAGGSRRGVPNWALTHPPAADRVARVQDVVAKAPAGARNTNAPEFERHLDGVIFGDSPEKGLVRNNEFLHPVLRFAVKFPEGWDVVNSESQVTARQSETGNVAMLLQLVDSTAPVQQVGPEQMSKAGWTEISGDRTSINGLEAYVGTYEGVSQGTRLRIMAAHVRAGSQTYVIAGLAPSGEFSGATSAFTSAIRTFRTLSRAEAEAIHPDRVDFYVVRNGDTWESIARTAGGSRVKPSTLAIMNGRGPATPPRVGDRIRIVVGG
ncbi:MAG: M48 family metalloprotease [Acidobacteriota bacterium]